jgi:hypothetical protein
MHSLSSRPRVEVRAERLIQPVDIRGVIFDMYVFGLFCPLRASSLKLMRIFPFSLSPCFLP